MAGDYGTLDNYDYLNGQVADIQQSVQQAQAASLAGVSGGAAGSIAVSNGTSFVSGSLVGTSNQVSVTTVGTTITLAGPQSLGTASSPTFAAITLGGGLKWVGYTSSAADPSTTELPADKDIGVHKNTASGLFYIAYNNAGAILKVQLT